MDLKVTCDICIRLKFKPNSVRIRFLSCQIFVLPSTGFELTPLIHCSTNIYITKCHVCRMPHYLHVIDILQRLLRRNRLVERWWPLTRLHYPTVSITSLLTCGNQNTRSIDVWPLYLYDILFINLFSWWVSDCCLTPAQQFFSYIVGRTS